MKNVFLLVFAPWIRMLLLVSLSIYFRWWFLDYLCLKLWSFNWIWWRYMRLNSFDGMIFTNIFLLILIMHFWRTWLQIKVNSYWRVYHLSWFLRSSLIFRGGLLVYLLFWLAHPSLNCLSRHHLIIWLIIIFIDNINAIFIQNIWK